MSQRPTAPASRPPAGITGLASSWSRLVCVLDAEGVERTWHLLDSWAASLKENETASLTVLCVHGNPSWSFLWRHVIAQSADDVRVIAIDQLDMGFSERTGCKRNLAMRIDDLCRLTDELEICGPVVTLAHDWGGPVSLGWAMRHLPSEDQPSEPEAAPSRVQLKGVVLCNTAVHQPAAASAPAVIRFIRSRLMLNTLTIRTTAFIRGAIKMSRPALSDAVKAGFMAPYQKASRRHAIADFVADIPLGRTHESADTLDNIAVGLDKLCHLPALLLWGSEDKVFSDLYLHDLERRLPQADVHRFPKAAHFVTEDAPVAVALQAWIQQFKPDYAQATRLDTENNDQARRSAALDNSLTDTSRRALADFSQTEAEACAVVETTPVERSINFRVLGEKTQNLAAGMATFGIAPGTRVAVMITPGIDLSLVVYACWRLGATLVLVDSGLGRAGMQGALKSANPAYLIGIDKALIAARLLGWPGQRIAVGSASSIKRRSLDIVSDLDTLSALGQDKKEPAWPTPETVAAIVFTSGSTGPSKGVVYLHQQIQAQRDTLMQLYGIGVKDRLVAAFAPFALYGPTMGITSIVPDMDVTKPGTLTAQSLAEAVKRVNATLVFASPAALVNVVATQDTLNSEARLACAEVRLALSAGAPIRASLLGSAGAVFPNASFHTPYGMTEVLPVADISLGELQAIEKKSSDPQTELVARAGVCVGYPVNGVRISIDPLDRQGQPTGALSTVANTLGEIIVSAPHIRYGYDRLWLTNHEASKPQGSHRSGDIGQLDTEGRLWVGGRLSHVIVTANGPIAPVCGEQIIESIDAVAMAALVGVGPAGTQAVVAVLQMKEGNYPTGGAPLSLINQVRSAIGIELDIASVLIVRQLPVDRRHNSKVDRAAIAQWAACVLAGDRVASL